MSESNLIWNQLVDELTAFETAPIREKGVLGYTIDGKYTVVVPERPHLFRVVMENGAYAEVEHRGHVSPTPGLNVIILRDENNIAYIAEADAVAARSAGSGTALTANVGIHNHARGSGMEFPVDWRLLLQLSPRIQQGLELLILPGYFYYNNEIKYLGNTIINLRANRPSVVNTWRWVLVGISTTTFNVVVTNGLTRSTTLPLRSSDLTSITTSGIIPLFAVKLRYGQSQITDSDIENLYQIVNYNTGGGGGGSSVDLETDVYWVCDGYLQFSDGDYVGIGV